MQSSFFDLENRHKKLDERDKPRKSKAGRKPFDVVLMFKAFVLQHLYNIGDDELEFQIRDRYSFCRFLGLSPEGKTPYAKTIWLFREQLTKKALTQALFYDFDYPLDEKGFKAQKGQIIDASFVEAPVQRNTREENAQIKAGKIPERFTEKGMFIRVIGLARAKTKIGLMNLVYNIRRCASLRRIAASTA